METKPETNESDVRGSLTVAPQRWLALEHEVRWARPGDGERVFAVCLCRRRWTRWSDNLKPKCQSWDPSLTKTHETNAAWQFWLFHCSLSSPKLTQSWCKQHVEKGLGRTGHRYAKLSFTWAYFAQVNDNLVKYLSSWPSKHVSLSKEVLF